MSDVAEIAAGLTVAQRRAMTNGVFNCSRRKIPCLRAHKTVRYNLCWLRLLTDYLGTPSLTPLGLAVRAHLESDRP